MLEKIEKIFKLSKKRIKYLEESNESWYKWYETYVDEMKYELKEVEDELKENNTVFLETELWDIFWDYMCLLSSLEEKWFIEKREKIFERCYKKFSERLSWIENWISWEEVKEKQKKELQIEHELKHKNKT